MREIVIIITALIALWEMSRGDAHFVRLPTESMPAVKVPRLREGLRLPLEAYCGAARKS
jgi:hypothetical protein